MRERQVVGVAGKIGEFRFYAAYVTYFAEPLQILNVNCAGMNDLRRRLWRGRWGQVRIVNPFEAEMHGEPVAQVADIDRFGDGVVVVIFARTRNGSVTDIGRA